MFFLAILVSDALQWEQSEEVFVSRVCFLN